MPAAYAAVRRQDLPIATPSANIVRRLGGPTMTAICATFLAWKLGSQGAEQTVTTVMRF